MVDYTRFQRGTRGAGEKDLLPAKAAEIRYEEDEPEVTRVVVQVERADGSIMLYDSREPQDFSLTTPMMTPMMTRPTRLAVGHGSGFSPVSHAVPSVNLRFTAHPRWNLHITTSSQVTWEQMRADVAAMDQVAAALDRRAKRPDG